MEVDHAISGYALTLMSGGFGWIELTHGKETVGYIYLTDEEPLPRDRIGNRAAGHGQPPYVVMHQRFAAMHGLLSVLDRGRSMRIHIQTNDAGEGEGFLDISSGTLMTDGRDDPRVPARTVAAG